MAADPAPTVPRFAPSERLLHWGFALTYLGLLATGLPLMVPTLRAWIRGYSPVIGLRLHLAAAVLWVGATLAVLALGDRRRLRATLGELGRLTREDWRWLRRFPRWLTAPAAERARLDGEVARFNGGQKANALFTLATSALLLLSGLALTPAGGDLLLAEWVTGRASVPLWREAHRWLTLLVLLPIAGHVYLAAVHPPTRPALGGMLDGQVDAAWAATHHPRWRPGAGGRPAP